MIRAVVAILIFVSAPAWALQMADRDGGSPAAVAAVKGVVKVRLRTLAAHVEVVTGHSQKVSVRLVDGAARSVSLDPDGADRLEVLFDGMPTLRCGKVCLTVPPQADVEVATGSGDVNVAGVGGEVRVHTISGDLNVSRAGSLDVRSVSGDVHADELTGDARIETVSGDAVVSAAAGDAPRVVFTSTSGDLTFNGTCGAGCRIEARTLSGEIGLKLSPHSSFGVHYISSSGEVNDDFKLAFSGGRKQRAINLRARHARGDGLIEVQTFSGDLMVAHAR